MTFADFVYGYFPHRHFWKKGGISTIVIVPDFHPWVPWSLMILSFLSVAFCRILRNVTLQKRKDYDHFVLFGFSRSKVT